MDDYTLGNGWGGVVMLRFVSRLRGQVLRRTALVALAAAVYGFAMPAFDAAQAEARKIKPTFKPSAFMRVYGQATAPYGWGQFCQMFHDQCREWRMVENRVPASADRLAELDVVNRSVNATVAPATDVEIYGVNEYWTLPGARGDCEDYALLKRKVLMAHGWPASALLMTVVRDETGEGHAVLTVRTAQGDFVLDNKVNDIKVWHETPYGFVMRQSYLNPNVWVSLDAGQVSEPAALAGLRAERR